jgi:hypothetical protein
MPVTAASNSGEMIVDSPNTEYHLWQDADWIFVVPENPERKPANYYLLNEQKRAYVNLSRETIDLAYAIMADIFSPLPGVIDMSWFCRILWWYAQTSHIIPDSPATARDVHEWHVWRNNALEIAGHKHEHAPKTDYHDTRT